MSVRYLPEAITKDILFEKAELRFRSWAQMYGDPNITASYMYEDMVCSCFCGCPADDFPEIVGPNKEDTIKYQYKNGACFFMIDGIEVEVLDLRDMRKDPTLGFERYADVCIPAISYTDPDGNFIHHPIPGAWLYGSTSHNFNEGEPVHDQFIKAARDFIKVNHITEEMQEVKDESKENRE